jgi:hypothetical protein
MTSALHRRACLPPSVFGVPSKQLSEQHLQCSTLIGDESETKSIVEISDEIEQWTEIGEAISTTYKPVTTLLRKSCDMCNLAPPTSSVACCNDNRCNLPRFAADGPNADLFSHPRTTIALPNVRRFRLFGRCQENSLQYAVADATTTCTSKPSLIVLAKTASRLATGDQIHVPGEFGAYNIFLHADRDIFRHEKSVFRGYSPVQRLPGAVRRHTPNSGLRNFTSHPAPNAMIFPF